MAIVGAGFAGAATAYHLARGGARVTVFDREPIAGAHASSQNAGILRACIPDAALARAAAAGAAGLASLERSLDAPVVRKSGSLLIAAGGAAADLGSMVDSCRAAGREARWIDPREAASRVPVLAGSRFDAAVLAAEDGVMDVAAYLDALLRGAREAGASVRLGVEVLGAERSTAGAMRLRTSAGAIDADLAVVAAGAWADDVAERLGTRPLGLVPHRRHLHATGPLAWVDPLWPFVWSVGDEVYFRPESGGLLLSPCDEEPFRPCEPPADPHSREVLAEKVARAFPALVDAPVMRSWAGLRTLARDRRFAIGPDPCNAAVFWVAALGGHGVTAAWEVGRLAADTVLRGRPPPAEFDPGRLVAA